MLNRKAVESFFETYTSTYDSSDPKIKLKIDHTYRVAALCEAIAESANALAVSPASSSSRTAKNLAGSPNSDLAWVKTPSLARDRADKSWGNGPAASITTRGARATNLASHGLDSERRVNPDLAWLSGMLHDIGRFEQIRRYNTFVDSQSIDHAQLSADLLFSEGLLQLLPVTLTKEQENILEVAIRSHSAYRLEPDLTEEEYTYCDILRDADKVDIFRVNCDTPKEDIYNVTTEELLTSPVSSGVKKCFDNRIAVIRSLRKYPADYIVGHICLYYELVYPLSRKIAREQGYLNKLLNFPSENPETRAWFAYMKKHIYT